MTGRTRVVVLISGHGSNLQAIHAAAERGEIPIVIAGVLSNNAEAEGLRWAKNQGLETAFLDHRPFASRAAFEACLLAAVETWAPDLVALAGFMRILEERFIRHYEGRMLNIHPALLPQFPGLNTHARALAAGVRQHGATVHFVTTEVDGGPIVAQAAVAVRPHDTVNTLAACVLEQEHRLYPKVIGWFAERRLSFNGRQALLDGKPIALETHARRD